jgi:hypothetical protein
MTAIGAIVRSAIDRVEVAGYVPTGTDGVELGWRSHDTIETDHMPHVFLFDPRSTEKALDFAQAEVTSTYRGEVWADVPQSQLAEWRQAIVEDCAANPRLNDTVRRFRLVTSGIIESFPGATGTRRVLVLEFSALTVEG